MQDYRQGKHECNVRGQKSVPSSHSSFRALPHSDEGHGMGPYLVLTIINSTPLAKWFTLSESLCPHLKEHVSSIELRCLTENAGRCHRSQHTACIQMCWPLLSSSSSSSSSSTPLPEAYWICGEKYVRPTVCHVLNMPSFMQPKLYSALCRFPDLHVLEGSLASLWVFRRKRVLTYSKKASPLPGLLHKAGLSASFLARSQWSQCGIVVKSTGTQATQPGPQF